MRTETSLLIATVKRLLKAQGMTYRDLAVKLGISEPSVKRLFSSGRLTVERLEEISHVLGYTLAEISKEAVSTQIRIDTLTENQERELVSDPRLLVVAVCAINNWTMQEIVTHYLITEQECVLFLLRLDRLRILDLLPGNRIRINVSRNFEWLPGGPIRQYFQTEGQADFLKCAFTREDESHQFLFGMLTEQAASRLLEELRILRQRMLNLHEESLSAPLDRRRGYGLMLAMRSWEPVEFASLRRREP